MAERTLPISATHRSFMIKVDGVDLPRQHQLLSATVTMTVNRISSARLVYLDGSASVSDFPLSNTATLLPGAEVEVLAGDGNAPSPLFQGIIVRQSIKVRDHTAPQLIVECRHKAAKLAVGRKNACFTDKTDSDIIDALLGAAGLTGDVESTTVAHEQVVQYRATDWDFLLARAHANGKLVLTNDATVTVRAPGSGGTATVSLQYGATVLELDAEIDARLQVPGVKAASWDPARQAVLEKEATAPAIGSQGNLSSEDLASAVGAGSDDLRHAAIGEEEAQAWADSRWLYSLMNKVSGRVKCEGIATVVPGDVVSLSGVGDRYSGDVFVTGVRHDFDQVQGWKTHVQFGGLAGPRPGEPDRSAPPAGSLIQAVRGLQVGVVTSNEDPENEHRVRIRLPLVDNGGDGVWSRVANPDAGDDRGFFFRPEVGDEVVVGFFEDDPRRPVMLGMLHSSAKAAPLSGSNENHEKLYQSRSKMKVSFDDESKRMELSTPSGNKITLSESDRGITISDQNGNALRMTPEGITLESSTALTVKAGTALTLQAGASFNLKGGGDLKLEGTRSAELSCAGTTTVRGALVQIN
jgi:Rhs element Vgr protein